MSLNKKSDSEGVPEQPPSTSNQPFNMMTTAGYDGLIEKFDGTDKTLSSSKWLQDIDDNAQLFGWTPIQKLIVARRCLTGTAELWVKSEKVFKVYEEFKTALQKEFPDSLNVKEIHEIMSARKKRKDETYYEYMLIMKELGRRGKFADYIAIQYIVDGIVDYESNKAILYGVTTYPVLKEKLAIYENMKKMAKKRQEPPQASTRERKVDYPAKTTKLTRNCYKCGEKDHMASTCKNGVKCYKCNQFGHIATACMNLKNQEVEHPMASKQREVSYGHGGRAPRWQPRAMCLKSAADEVANSDNDISGESMDNQYGGASGDTTSDRSCQCQQVLNVNKTQNINKSVKMLEIGGLKVESLIDSGSDLNLITVDLFFELNVTSYVKEKIEFSGLGDTKMWLDCSKGGAGT